MKQLKYVIGLVGMSFVLFSFSNCGGSKADASKYSLTQTPDFTLGEVYYQDWVSGIQEGGSGTNVYISFNNFTKDIVVKDIYFRKKILEAQQNGNQYIGYYKNEMERDIIMDGDPKKEAQNTPPKKFPFDLKDNEAVISYLQSGEMKYYKISGMEKKDMIAYPQTKPDNKN